VAGSARATRKTWFNARACAARAWFAVASAPCLLAAEPGHVENRCPRLSPSAYDELDARVLLLLEGDEENRKRVLPAIVCSRGRAYVEWEGQRYDIVGRAPIVDEAVDIVEGVLHDEERRADADPRTAEAGAVTAGEPMLVRGPGDAPPPPPNAQRADPLALVPKDARGGGIAIGFQTELPSSSIGVAVGPAFDFGACVGPLVLGGREAIRFTVKEDGRQLSFMDFQAAVGYGAPFNPDARFGIVTRFGAEWMVAYPEGNSGQAVVAPVVDVGLRVAHGLGLVSLWIGVDAHFRLSPLRLRAQGEVAAEQVTGSLTLGAAFVDWSRK
jgi:hypothetical protein